MTTPSPFTLISVAANPPQVFGDVQSVTQTSNQMLTVAQEFMSNLTGATWFQSPSIDPSFPTIPTAPQPVTAAMPALQSVAWSLPAAPVAPGGFAPEVGLYPKSPTFTPPSLIFGTPPSPDYGLAPDAPAIDLNFTLPTLDLNLPVAPDLLSLSVTPFAGVDLPSFDAQAPALNIAAPNIIPYVEGPTYFSALLTSLQADLQGAISDGSYLTLAKQAQDALWDAGREREYRQQADALEALERDHEMLGYAFPPGVYMDARLKIQTETNNTIAGLQRDIIVKQAELQLENLIKAREQAVALESKQIDYANQVAQRAFESAKFVAEAAIQVYNALVETYKASLDGYRTEAAVFETLMRGAQAKVDIYKAELDAERLKTEINTALVQQYEAKIRAQSLFVDIYKAQLSSIETQANLQKIVVEAYGEQVRAYGARINGFTSEVEAYKAQTESQSIQVNAYKAQAETFNIQTDAADKQVRAWHNYFDLQVRTYAAKLEGYKSSVTAMAEQARAASEYNTAAAEVYRAEMGAITSYNDVVTKQWQAAIEISEKVAEVGVQAAKANGDLFLQTKNIAVEAAKGGAQVAAQIGAAALNAIHFTNSSSWSSSNSASLASSVSNAYSGSINQSVNASV